MHYVVSQLIAVWCSVLQCVTVYFAMEKRGSVISSVLQCAVVYCGVLLYVLVFGSVFVQCVTGCCNILQQRRGTQSSLLCYSVLCVMQCVAVCTVLCYIVLQCVLQGVAVCFGFVLEVCNWTDLHHKSITCCNTHCNKL